MDWPRRIRWLIVTAVLILAWGTGMARFTDAAAPYADATIAGLSVAAQILQSIRKVESWVLWIAVDAFAVGLFIWRGLQVTSGLYALFFILACVGLREWARRAKA
jgi:nicotinamide mononucleotide transporter